MARIAREVQRWINRLPWRQKEDEPEPVPEPEEPSSKWYSHRATITAQDGVIKFRTRNILPANTPDGRNRDNGFEWIIAIIGGTDFNRLLIMVMGGNRPASRIGFEQGSIWEETNSRFPVPLEAEAEWEVTLDGRTMRVFLDGREIWSRACTGRLTRSEMLGWPNREARAEWRA